MQEILEDIKKLFAAWSGDPVDRIDKIPQSGSNRMYFRIRAGGKSLIATYNNHVAENASFIRFSRHFRLTGNPVPEIFAVNETWTAYLQEDFGDLSLLGALEDQGYTDQVFGFFQESLRALARLQILGGRDLDYSWCITSREFGKQAILSDLLYFKYYFLDTLEIPYDKERLINDFETLSAYLTQADHKYFMFRDFQSRNIMLREEKVHFIDFQGGMQGALQYDVASMLWQAKAALPDSWKERLLQSYMDRVEEIRQVPLDRDRFKDQYHGYVLIRLLQVLGAYGFRGLFERKAHFLISIPLGLKNLKGFLERRDPGMVMPEFERVLRLVVEDEILERFTPLRANDQTPLLVRITSFSYRFGVPEDPSGNGGGFVFDCRSILNPGRLERFASQTGRDREVKDFLEQETKMPEFLNSVYSLVDIAVTDFLKRGFSSLVISFGCTGGQHRSVYAADALARHLRNKFNTRIDLHHREQEARNWVNKE